MFFSKIASAFLTVSALLLGSQTWADDLDDFLIVFTVDNCVNDLIEEDNVSDDDISYYTSICKDDLDDCVNDLIEEDNIFIEGDNVSDDDISYYTSICKDDLDDCVNDLIEEDNVNNISYYTSICEDQAITEKNREIMLKKVQNQIRIEEDKMHKSRNDKPQIDQSKLDNHTVIFQECFNYTKDDNLTLTYNLTILRESIPTFYCREHMHVYCSTKLENYANDISNCYSDYQDKVSKMNSRLIDYFALDTLCKKDPNNQYCTDKGRKEFCNKWPNDDRCKRGGQFNRTP